MSEISVEVVPVLIKYLCDSCKTELRCTGSQLLSNPPKFVHMCPKCQKEYILSKAYPAITYIEPTKTEFQQLLH